MSCSHFLMSMANLWLPASDSLESFLVAFLATTSLILGVINPSLASRKIIVVAPNVWHHQVFTLISFLGITAVGQFLSRFRIYTPLKYLMLMIYFVGYVYLSGIVVMYFGFMMVDIQLKLYSVWGGTFRLFLSKALNLRFLLLILKMVSCFFVYLNPLFNNTERRLSPYAGGVIVSAMYLFKVAEYVSSYSISSENRYKLVIPFTAIAVLIAAIVTGYCKTIFFQKVFIACGILLSLSFFFIGMGSVPSTEDNLFPVLKALPITIIVSIVMYKYNPFFDV